MWRPSLIDAGTSTHLLLVVELRLPRRRTPKLRQGDEPTGIDEDDGREKARGLSAKAPWLQFITRRIVIGLRLSPAG